MNEILPGIDVPAMLREIAAKIESKEYDVEAFDFNFPPTYDAEKNQWIPNFKMLIL
jgi:hypothetical protein